MIRLLIADDEKLEREALAELVQRRFEREVVLEVAENGRKAADTAVLWGADQQSVLAKFFCFRAVPV